MSPPIRALIKRKGVELTIVHSGQHYDFEMSAQFFEQLKLPRPDINLTIGSGSHAEQTSQMMSGYEKVIGRVHPDIVLAVGDTNTVLAAGLASVKLKVPFGHIEAGLRCFDRTMPEEINRTVADDCAQLCFAPTHRSAQNLFREGILPQRVFVTGNTIVDACLSEFANAQRHSRIFESLGLAKD